MKSTNNTNILNSQETIDLFLRDPLSVVTMNPKQIKFLQKCIEKSKKHRPLTEYNIFVKEQIDLLKNDDTFALPKDKIKHIAALWKTNPVFKKHDTIIKQSENS